MKSKFNIKINTPCVREMVHQRVIYANSVFIFNESDVLLKKFIESEKLLLWAVLRKNYLAISLEETGEDGVPVEACTIPLTNINYIKMIRERRNDIL